MYDNLISILVISILLLSSNVFAHEIGPGHVYRWGGVFYSDYAGHNFCYLQSNGDYLNTPYSSRYSSAVSEWTDNSNIWVQYVNTSFSTSNVDLATYNMTWPSEWGNYTVAITAAYDSNGNCALDGNFNSGTITHAQIYTNPNRNSAAYNDFKRDYVLRHEMGHVLGLGHPDASTSSIMHAEIDDTYWSNIQDHDRSDLQSFYQ